MAGTITIGGAAEGLTSGSKTIGPLTILGSATLGEVHDQALTSGDNTITVPATATAAIIVPPSSGTVTIKLKGAAGDTGLFLSEKYPIVLPFDPAHLPATFILNAGGTVTVELTFI